MEYLWVASRIINLSGHIENNPGPRSNVLNWCFSICHWNLNSKSPHKFTKAFLPSVYLSNLILFVSPKRISILKSHLMRNIWRYLDKILSEKITHLTVNVRESVLTLKACSHLI